MAGQVCKITFASSCLPDHAACLSHLAQAHAGVLAMHASTFSTCLPLHAHLLRSPARCALAGLGGGSAAVQGLHARYLEPQRSLSCCCEGLPQALRNCLCFRAQGCIVRSMLTAGMRAQAEHAAGYHCSCHCQLQLVMHNIIRDRKVASACKAVFINCSPTHPTRPATTTFSDVGDGPQCAAPST